METTQFKTTIKCSGCVANATPFLDATVGTGNWKVDIQHPDKVLSIDADKNVSPAEVIKAIQDAGFKAEPIL